MYLNGNKINELSINTWSIIMSIYFNQQYLNFLKLIINL